MMKVGFFIYQLHWRRLIHDTLITADDDEFMACLCQRNAGVGTDIACTASDKDFHVV